MSEARSEPRDWSRPRAFEVHTSSQQPLPQTVPYTPCTDRFSIAEYKVCEPLYDALVHSYSNHYEITLEAPSRSTALTRCLRKSAISGSERIGDPRSTEELRSSGMTKDGSASRLSNHDSRTSSCGFLARRSRASGPRDRRSLAVVGARRRLLEGADGSLSASIVGAADQSAPYSPTRRWTVRATAAHLNTAPATHSWRPPTDS